MTTTRPLISIVMATCNASAHVGRAIQSVVDQTFGSWELVIQDNQSVDGTLDVISAFSDDRIRCSSEVDDGIYDALNRAVHRASGTWVLVLGSDDWLHDQMVLEDIVPMLTKTTADLVYGNVLIDGKCGIASEGSEYCGQMTKHTLVKQNICQQSIFYRREKLLALGAFELQFHTCADWVTNMRFFATSDTLHVDRRVAVFSGGGASTSKDHEFEFQFRSLVGSILGPECRRLAKPAIVRFVGLACGQIVSGDLHGGIKRLFWYSRRLMIQPSKMRSQDASVWGPLTK